jgi:hypothetical protein
MLPLSTKNRRDNFTFWQRGKKGNLEIEVDSCHASLSL